MSYNLHSSLVAFVTLVQKVICSEQLVDMRIGYKWGTTISFENDKKLFRPVINFANIDKGVAICVLLFRYSTKYKTT